MRKTNLLFIFVFFLSACAKVEQDTDAKREGYDVVDLTRSTTDVMLPAELWDKMEAVYHPTYTEGFGKKNEGTENHKSVTAKIEVPTQYMSLKVFLKEEDKGVLGGKNLALEFGLGGGELDFSRFLKKPRKSFSLSIVLDEQIGVKDTLKVYFLSNGKKQKISGLEWGAGCNKYLDITGYYWKRLSRKGISTNTSSLRYLHLLSGSYFFVLNKNNALYLAQLKITDSRYKEVYCRN